MRLAGINDDCRQSVRNTLMYYVPYVARSGLHMTTTDDTLCMRQPRVRTHTVHACKIVNTDFLPASLPPASTFYAIPANGFSLNFASKYIVLFISRKANMYLNPHFYFAAGHWIFFACSHFMIDDRPFSPRRRKKRWCCRGHVLLLLRPNKQTCVVCQSNYFSTTWLKCK